MRMRVRSLSELGPNDQKFGLAAMKNDRNEAGQYFRGCERTKE
jgi:hypothetical protein